jgi:integrase
MATIRKVKNKDGSMSYRVRVVVGHKDDGTPKQQMRTYPTRREADAASRSMETDRDRGGDIAAKRMRMGAYLDDWLARAAMRVRPSTLHGYRYAVEHHIRPGLGGLVVRDLTPTIVQKWIDTLSTPKMAHRCRSVLHNILEEAVRLNLLMMNPVDRISTPPMPPSIAQAWSSDEAKRLLAVAQNHLYQPYWSLALGLALRPSELLGLKWSAIDLAAATLEVREARPTVGVTSFQGAPKSEAGKRILDLPSALVKMLHAHHAEQLARSQKLGEVWVETGLVCTNERGEPIEYSHLTRAFKRLRKRANVSDIRLYDLRHTAITLMAATGADLKAVSEVAGHANVQITRNIYQHTNRKQRAAVIDALAEVLEESTDEETTGVLNTG